MNSVTVSGDRMELTISSPNGHRAVLRSARRGGFTAEDIEHAKMFKLGSTMVDGQVNRARRVHVCGKAFYVHVNTGPPTWWRPRMQISPGTVMVGWFRVLVAVSWPRR